MSLSLIKGALENKVISIIPNINTNYEGVNPNTPVSGVPYQSLYFMPATNEGSYINDKAYLARGIFQISLFYPFGVGTKDIMERVNLYLNAFAIGTQLVNQGVTVSISDTPDVVRIGQSGDRYVIHISIPFKSLIG